MYKFRNNTTLGGIPEYIINDFDVIKFIDLKDLKSCKEGNFLIGSVVRNKKFNDARCDSGEMTISIDWENTDKEEWTLRGKDCKKYIGIEATKKFKAIKGSGGLSIKNQPIAIGNPYSLSLSLIPKNISKEKREEVIHLIRESIGLAKDVALLKVNNPNELIKLITKKMNNKVNRYSLISCSKMIEYKDRVLKNGSFKEFKKEIDKKFHSNALHLDYLFIKPNSYSLDNEYRVIWIGHSGSFYLNVQVMMMLVPS